MIESINSPKGRQGVCAGCILWGDCTKKAKGKLCDIVNTQLKEQRESEIAEEACLGDHNLIPSYEAEIRQLNNRRLEQLGRADGLEALVKELEAAVTAATAEGDAEIERLKKQVSTLEAALESEKNPACSTCYHNDCVHSKTKTSNKHIHPQCRLGHGNGYVPENRNMLRNTPSVIRFRTKD